MINQKARDKFTEFLKRGRHRITPERFDVLEAALQLKGHFGADDLYVRMKNDNMNISRATVYNTLELLAQCELLAKRHFGDNKTHYESQFNRKGHDHLICVNCGQIHEFDNREIVKIVDEVSEKLGFESTGYSLTVFGKCMDKEACDLHRSSNLEKE